jgi:hypothetical protein
MGVRYSDAEHASVREAAGEAGLTPTGFVAQAALAVARGGHSLWPAPLRAALIEVMAARTEVSRYRTLDRQATDAVGVTGALGVAGQGEESAELSARAGRAVQRLDDAAAELVARLR